MFATAFMIRLEEMGDPVESARFASVAPSFGVEQASMGGIPGRETILACMQERPLGAATGEP